MKRLGRIKIDIMEIGGLPRTDQSPTATTTAARTVRAIWAEELMSLEWPQSIIAKCFEVSKIANQSD